MHSQGRENEVKKVLTATPKRFLGLGKLLRPGNDVTILKLRTMPLFVSPHVCVSRVFQKQNLAYACFSVISTR